MLATGISIFLSNYFFMEPLHTLALETRQQQLTTGMFTLMGIIFASVMQHAKNNQARRLMAEARFRQIIQDAPLGIALVDSHTGRIHEINRRFAAIAGRTPEQLLATDWMSITHPDDIQEDLVNMARLNAGKTDGFQMNKRYLKPDGSVVWISMTIAPTCVTSDQSPRHLCMIEDITARHETEQRLDKMRNRQKVANDVAEIGIWDWDLLTNRLEWDDRLCEWYQLTPEERKAGHHYERWRAWVHPDDIAQAEAGLHEALHQTGHYDGSFRIRRPDGSMRFIRCVADVIYDADHRPLRIFGINQDVTAQQAQLAALSRAQADLARLGSERRLDAIIEQGLIGLVELDTEGRVRRINDRFLALLGYSREELLGKTFSNLTDLRDLAESEACISDLLAHGRHFTLEKRYRCKDGHHFWGKVVMMPVLDPETQKRQILALIIDVDVLKQAEERLRLALTGSQIGMYDWDINTDRITWSADHERIWGYQPGEFDGTLEGFTRRIHPDDLLQIQEQLDTARKTGAPYRQDFRVIWPDGSEHYVSSRGEFEYDEYGQATHLRGTVLDVTEREILHRRIQLMNADLEKQVADRTAELELALKTKGQFVANISHELRNPLNSINLQTYLLCHDGLNEEQNRIANNIQANVSSLAMLIDDILDFSKMESGQFVLDIAPFSLDTLVNALKIQNQSAADNKGLTLHWPDVPWQGDLLGDMKRLQQIICNLLGNAIKFTEQGDVWMKLTLENQTARNVTLKFEVMDSGIGIQPGVIPHLLEPFTQADSSITRRFGGTGLGLSISKHLVGLMGGEISIASTPGLGSVFTFTLTLTKAQYEQISKSTYSSGREKRLDGLSVLLVDDCKNTLEVTRLVLEKEGAIVHTATNGELAFNWLRDHPGQCHVVLMDIQMPVMDGITATRLIRNVLKLKDLPILAVTAGILPDQQLAALDVGITEMMRKPVDIETLVEKLICIKK